MDTENIQKEILEFKQRNGFNITDLHKEFGLLKGEVDEAVEALEQYDTDNYRLELADIAIYLLGIAEISHVNLGSAIQEKMEINKHRKWEQYNEYDR